MLFEFINNFNEEYNFSIVEIKNIISDVSNNENQSIKSINLILSTDNHLNKLKNTYFNKDHYTDVIAFNLEDSGDLIDGEIYISMDRIIENSDQFNCDINDELKRIIIHGLLHLIGYNDSTKEEKKSMTNLENSYLAKLSKPIII